MKKVGLLANAWVALCTLALAVPLVAWGTGIDWQLSRVTLYAFFPLLGLFAFSLMWLQIVTLRFQDALEQSGAPARSFLSKSGIFVLVLIVAHPLLLAIAMFQQGAGLPVGSLYAYEPPMLQIFVSYALIAWTIFILTEVTLHLQKVALVKQAAKVIEYINYSGFFLIFWHSIRLGSNLQQGWLRDIWWFYGVSSILLLGNLLWKKRAQKSL